MHKLKPVYIKIQYINRTSLHWNKIHKFKPLQLNKRPVEVYCLEEHARGWKNLRALLI